MRRGSSNRLILGESKPREINETAKEAEYTMRSLVIMLIGLALLSAAVLTFRHIDATRAQPVRDLSRMMSVQHILSLVISAHYKQHGKFPKDFA